MAEQGWQKLLAGYPWFAGEGNYPIAAYSEFMPPPRVGRKPYGSIDHCLYAKTIPSAGTSANTKKPWNFSRAWR